MTKNFLFLADQVESASSDFVKMHIEKHLTSTEEIDVVEVSGYSRELGRTVKVSCNKQALLDKLFNDDILEYENKLTFAVKQVLKRLWDKQAIAIYNGKWKPINGFSQKDIVYACYKTVGDYIVYHKLEFDEYVSSRSSLPNAAVLTKMFGFNFTKLRTKMKDSLPKNRKIIDEL